MPLFSIVKNSIKYWFFEKEERIYRKLIQTVLFCQQILEKLKYF
ncbi:tetratricopeptide (TPR) domain protein [Streptococcus sanguinis SK72]|uniref:Tetratricopeptide (TPR) domain protein n=1 Tax=Streptococcus sanguinis SK72 TaxID=888809 RepID=F0I4H9_STRSA|nr:tetratricopeptide (TPR) domain protein [Streptococcus sanguinis SK72]